MSKEKINNSDKFKSKSFNPFSRVSKTDQVSPEKKNQTTKKIKNSGTMRDSTIEKLLNGETTDLFEEEDNTNKLDPSPPKPDPLETAIDLED